MDLPQSSGRSFAPVAIVGGRGYLGGAIASALLNLNIPHWIVARQSPPADDGPTALRSSVPSLSAAVDGASTVVHVASVSSPALGFADPSLDIENLRLTASLLGACRDVRVRHFIFVSSGGTVYGEASEPLSEDQPLRPICSYGIGKMAEEAYCRMFAEQGDLAVSILRVSNVYGGRQRTKGGQAVVFHLIQTIRRGEPVHVFGDTVRDYLYIEDLAAAVVAALPLESGLRVVNVSTGIGTSLVALTRQLADFMGRPVDIVVGERRPFDLGYNVLLNHRAQASLGWRPTVCLRDGLERTIHAVV